MTVPGISDTYRTETGQKKIDSGKGLLYFGHEENASYTQRVALILSKEFLKELRMGILWIRDFQNILQNKTLGGHNERIQCYAPAVPGPMSSPHGLF